MRNRLPVGIVDPGGKFLDLPIGLAQTSIDLIEDSQTRPDFLPEFHVVLQYPKDQAAEERNEGNHEHHTPGRQAKRSHAQAPGLTPQSPW